MSNLPTSKPNYVACACGSPYAHIIQQGSDWREIACDECEEIWIDGNDPQAKGVNS